MDFNDVLQSVDSVLFDLLGASVVVALHDRLRDRYNVVSEEIPYRLDMALTVLETVFGVTGTRTIARVVARRLYHKYGLVFVDRANDNLQDYVEQAKKELAAKLNEKRP